MIWSAAEEEAESVMTFFVHDMKHQQCIDLLFTLAVVTVIYNGDIASFAYHRSTVSIRRK